VLLTYHAPNANYHHSSHTAIILSARSSVALRIYNTMSRTKEEFVPLVRNFVRIYTCGLTVYDYAHIGHARTYLFWDVVRRYLTWKGYDVYAIINNTDIDDKNIARAQELGVPVFLLGRYFACAFYADMEAFGMVPYALDCFASEYIPEMIETVKRIVDNGYGYVVDGDVFFEVAKYPDYGKLSHHKLEDLIAGERVEVDPRKRSPADFALWKAAKPGEPTWDSPWGPGRPGWHVECSTMAYNFLGGTYDIKGGAVDNLFPHHENEIAQTWAAYGIPLAKYYMHPEHLLVEGTKMSKSLGNFITARELLADWNPAVIRLFFLGTHYRTQMNFTKDGLAAAQSSWEKLQQFERVAAERIPPRPHGWVVTPEERARLDPEDIWTKLAAQLAESFSEAMDDDFNTPRAVAALFSLLTEANRQGIETSGGGGELMAALETWQKLTGVLGLRATRTSLTGIGVEGENTLGERLVSSLVARREQARKAGDFATADLLRELLDQSGVQLEDTATGTRWKITNPSKGKGND